MVNEELISDGPCGKNRPPNFDGRSSRRSSSKRAPAEASARLFASVPAFAIFSDELVCRDCLFRPHGHFAIGQKQTLFTVPFYFSLSPNADISAPRFGGGFMSTRPNFQWRLIGTIFISSFFSSSSCPSSPSSPSCPCFRHGSLPSPIVPPAQFKCRAAPQTVPVRRRWEPFSLACRSFTSSENFLTPFAAFPPRGEHSAVVFVCASRVACRWCRDRCPRSPALTTLWRIV